MAALTPQPLLFGLRYLKHFSFPISETLPLRGKASTLMCSVAYLAQ